MTEPVVIIIPGAPRGKQRPRFSGKSGTAYTPEPTRQYEATVGRLALVAMRGRQRLTGPLHLDLRVHFQIPPSWSKERRESALLGIIRPTSRPDLSNCQKAVEDGMEKIVYDDDAAIVSATTAKVYGAGEAFVVATVKPVSSRRVPESITPEGTHERSNDRP